MERYVKHPFREAAVSLIFPEKCRLCGREAVRPFACLCVKCRREMKRIPGTRCVFCGMSKKDCRCRKQKHMYSSVTAPFYYTGSVRDGLHNWKFRGHIEATQFFAANIADELSEELKNGRFDMLTFVPQTENDMSGRGFNQAELLAGVLGEYIGIEARPLLEKTFETLKQHDLPEYRRKGNVLGVFEVIDEELVRGKNILLVDDIKTTGTVLNECAKMLMLAGADDVFCAAAAVSK